MYYIIYVWGCVEPQPLDGPYESFELMRIEAEKFWQSEDARPERDCIFYLLIDGDGPSVHSFTNDDLGDC